MIRHNSQCQNEEDKIRSVLCPGLGTAVGRMPFSRCAAQVIEYMLLILGLYSLSLKC